MQSTDLPRILALIPGEEIAHIRVVPFMEALHRAGKIAGYSLVDRDMRHCGPQRFQRYSHVIVQRDIGAAQWRWLKRNRPSFIYDIDDFVVDFPSDIRRDKRRPKVERVAWCLRHARAITAPHRFLVDRLEEFSGIALGDRFVPLPNGLRPFPADLPRRNERARTLIWVSSAVPLIHEESPDLVRAIAEATNTAGLSALLIGSFPPEILALFEKHRHVEYLPFAELRRLLAAEKRAIGIAPLPNGPPARLQSFIDSKSDIKVVEFLGHGIPAVFSDARPYAESDIRPPVLVRNEPRAWADAIGRLAADPTLGIDADIVERIHRTRDFAVLACGLHEKALLAGATADISGRFIAVPAIFRNAERALRRVLKPQRTA